MGGGSNPSHRWPRIQACARPTRQVGTRFRAPKSAAKITNANPMAPNVRPIVLPPRGPRGDSNAYQTYPAAEIAAIARDTKAQPSCVRSILILRRPAQAYRRKMSPAQLDARP